MALASKLARPELASLGSVCRPTCGTASGRLRPTPKAQSNTLVRTALASAAAAPSTPTEAYNELIASGKINPDERQAEIERGHDNLTRVTLSTLAYLRQVEQRGALIQRLLNSAEVRAGLRAEREQQRGYSRRRMTDRLTTQYGVEADLARGATVVLTAVCLRAGRLLAERKIPLAMAERLSLAIVTAGNREIVREPGLSRPRD